MQLMNFIYRQKYASANDHSFDADFMFTPGL